MLTFLANVPVVGCPGCRKSLSWNDLVHTNDGYTVSCWRCGFTLYTLNGQGASRQALRLVGRQMLTASRAAWFGILNDTVRMWGGSADPNPPDYLAADGS